MDNIKQKTFNGIIWKSIQSFATTGLSFLFMIFMTRLLTPNDYGLIGMLSVFIVLAQTFIDSGFGQALVRENKRTIVDESTVFFFNLIASTLCYIILYISAPFIAQFYDMPILKNILRIQGLMLIISAFYSVHLLIYSINLDFKTPTIIGLLCNLLSGISGIVMAYYGWGVWALVGQQLLLTIFSAICYSIISSWKPQLVFSFKSFKRMFSFGSKLLGSRLLNITYNKAAPIFIGKYYSASDLGLYSKAEQIASFPCNTFYSIISSVSYPVLCKLQTDKTQLTNIYRKFIRVTAFVIFPVMLLLCIFGTTLMSALFGEKWINAGIYLSIMSLPWMMVPIQCLNLNILLVTGRSDLMLRLEIIGKVLGFTVLFITLPINIIVFSISSAIVSFTCFFINTYYTKKVIQYPLKEQILDLLTPLITSLTISITAFLCTMSISNDMIKLVIGITSGSLLYIIIAHCFKIHEYSELKSLIKQRFIKSGKS